MKDNPLDAFKARDRPLAATAGQGVYTTSEPARAAIHHRHPRLQLCLRQGLGASWLARVVWIKWQVGHTRVYFVAHGWHSAVLAASGLAALAAASCSFSARPAALCRHLQARGALAPTARGWQPSPQSCVAVRRHAGVAFHRAKHGQAAVPHEAAQVQAPTAPLSACGRATFGAGAGNPGL